MFVENFPREAFDLARPSAAEEHHGIIVTNPSVDSGSGEMEPQSPREGEGAAAEHGAGRLLSTSEEGGEWARGDQVGWGNAGCLPSPSEEWSR